MKCVGMHAWITIVRLVDRERSRCESCGMEKIDYTVGYEDEDDE